MADALMVDGEDWRPDELAGLVRAARALVRSVHFAPIADAGLVRVIDTGPHSWRFLEALDARYDRHEWRDPALREPVDAAR